MHRPDPRFELLRAVPGLGSLSDKDLAGLVVLLDEIRVDPGHILTREGVVAREAFIVVEGKADVFLDGELIATVGPGEFVGEMGMLERWPRVATVRASTPMVLLVIGPKVFAAFVDHPGVGRAMATQLSQRRAEAEPSP